MKYIFLVNPPVIGNSGTFSLLNRNATVWYATASSALQIPQLYLKGSPVYFPGLFVGSHSTTEFYVNNLTLFDSSSMLFNNLGTTTTTLSRGTNHHTTDITTTQTVLLPSNPKVGDYVWYENHPSTAGRYIVTVDGNGIQIRTSTNSIQNTTLEYGLFHYDGTYWNNIYEA